MAQRPGSRPPRPRQSASRRPTRQTRNLPPSNNGSSGGGVRDRLRRDPFLFMLCLGALAFVTWAFALTWWVTGGVLALAMALVSIAPAIFLFYLRDA